MHTVQYGWQMGLYEFITIFYAEFAKRFLRVASRSHEPPTTVGILGRPACPHMSGSAILPLQVYTIRDYDNIGSIFCVSLNG